MPFAHFFKSHSGNISREYFTQSTTLVKYYRILQDSLSPEERLERGSLKVVTAAAKSALEAAASGQKDVYPSFAQAFQSLAHEFASRHTLAQYVSEVGNAVETAKTRDREGVRMKEKVSRMFHLKKGSMIPDERVVVNIRLHQFDKDRLAPEFGKDLLALSPMNCRTNDLLCSLIWLIGRERRKEGKILTANLHFYLTKSLRIKDLLRALEVDGPIAPLVITETLGKTFPDAGSSNSLDVLLDRTPQGYIFLKSCDPPLMFGNLWKIHIAGNKRGHVLKDVRGYLRASSTLEVYTREAKFRRRKDDMLVDFSDWSQFLDMAVMENETSWIIEIPDALDSSQQHNQLPLHPKTPPSPPTPRSLSPTLAPTPTLPQGHQRSMQHIPVSSPATSRPSLQTFSLNAGSDTATLVSNPLANKQYDDMPDHKTAEPHVPKESRWTRYYNRAKAIVKHVVGL